MRKIILSIALIFATLITPISAYEIDDIPEYNGSPYIEIHDNEPQFNSKDMNKKSFESYSNLTQSSASSICECFKRFNAYDKTW